MVACKSCSVDFFRLVRRNNVRVQSRRMDSSEHTRRARHRRGSHPRTPQAYRICDWITEGGLYFTVLFAPWAFGTTERWSIWTLNVAGYILGLLLFSKWLIRLRAGF